MAANKFATMLHRNTNKLTMILVYAVLEWILISLLLINSLFSYLIIKFADYVGLKPPCLWCSRIDHILESKENKNMHRDLLCEAHAKEVSLLSFCSNHQKLTESQELCEDCLSSKREFGGVSKSFAFFGMVQTNGEEKIVESELDCSCSCCGVILERNKMVNHIVIKPSWDVLEYAKKEKGELISEVDDDDDHVEKGVNIYDENRSDDIEKMVSYVNEVLQTLKEEEVVEEKDEDEGKEEENVEEYQEVVILKKDQGVQVVDIVGDDHSIELLPQHLEFFIDCSGHRLVPVELIDSATEEDHNKFEEELPKDEGYRSIDISPENNLLINEERKDDIDDGENENSLMFHAKEISEREEVNEPTSQLDQSSIHDSEINVVIQKLEAIEEEEQQHSDVQSDEDEGETHMNQNETDADVSIGTEIPDLDHVTDDIMQTHDMEEEEEEEEEDEAHTQENTSTSLVNPEAYVHGSFQDKEQIMEFNDLSVEVNGNARRARSLSIELSEIEEDRVPDTPSSVESLHHLHKKLLQLEKRDSGTEDSLDGSVTSDLEGIVGDGGVITVDQLKSAIKAERKALHAIYSELEEERNASAIAANQTMAMINRLHEEKAAMQMEALQYQRMMEEQAEYDQEALQLLNELMVKREKEKEELEKELDTYRKKLLEYESREKLRMLRRMNKDETGRSGFSSPSCSDAASIDLNKEVKEDEDGFYSHRHKDFDNENTPIGAVLNLDDSIADFEEERLSILEQLKGLEEKLMTLDDNDDEEEYLHQFEDIASPTDYHGESNGIHVLNENGHHEDLENGHAANGILAKKNGNEKYHTLKSNVIGPMGKSLLPLFDATSDENGDIMLTNGHENGFHDSDNGVDNNSCSLQTLDEGSKRRFAVEEELDHLYERLQALEADREFLKHCISSLNKGDKGMHLLHEILHHLKSCSKSVGDLTDSTLK
ncbi:hypothetical protein Leryth_007880 [Lithospermum erythrorhizon]|nr:hypothetical protein Leryth_007880 [Lithospermum erythrorhizon]